MTSDCIDASGNTAWFQSHDLLDRLGIAEVDRDCALLLCKCKSLWDVVHAVDPRGASNLGCVQCHQTDGSCAEDGNGITSLEACEVERLPACGKDV